MADPASETKTNPILDTISTVLGGSVFRPPARDAEYMLALLQPKEAVNSEDFKVGAQGIYERWFEQAQRNITGADLSAEDMIVTVRAQMANHIIAELSELNGGKPFSEGAQQEIQKLLGDNDAEGFVNALMENRQAVFAQLERNRIAKQNDPKAATSDIAGIMLLLAKDNPALAKVDVDPVDVSPVEVAKATEHSVFKNIFRLNYAGNGSESLVAMIEGIPREDWGAYNKVTGGYANLEGFSGPANPEERREFWNGEEGARITDLIEKRGVVEFANDEAREAWIREMADALTGSDPVANARELTDRMREFAQESPAITMESEVAQQQDLSPVSDFTHIMERRNFITFGDADARHAWNAEAHRIFEEHGNIDVGELAKHAKDFVETYNQEHPTAIVIQHDNIAAAKASHEAAKAEVARAAADEAIDRHIEANGVPVSGAVEDPVCAEGVDTYLLGKHGVACITTAEHGETPTIPAVAEVARELRSVPVVDPAVVAPAPAVVGPH